MAPNSSGTCDVAPSFRQAAGQCLAVQHMDSVESKGSEGPLGSLTWPLRHQRVAQATRDTANRCTTRVS